MERQAEKDQIVKIPYLSLDVTYKVWFNKEHNKTECLVCVDPQYPIFVNRKSKPKSYSNKRLFMCKPIQFETMLHGILGQAHKRFKKLQKTAIKTNNLPQYKLSVSTAWWFIDKREAVENNENQN